MSDADAADMRALQRGDSAALDRLMDRWQAPLRGFLYRLTQNEQDARDLAQETFVRVYLHRQRFRSGARFSTWLFQIALNLARDLARRQRHRRGEPTTETTEPATAETAALALERDERVRAVRAAIAELPADLREAVLLFEYEDKSHAEIAAIVRATPKAVETRLYRARQQLKKILSRFL